MEIPYGRQTISKDDIDSVVSVLRSDFLTQGPVVPRFEKELCNYTGAKYASVVNSCTSALHIACLSLGLGPGDVLWTSPITFAASANCALYCGASVDFVDINPDTALMSVESLRKKLAQAEIDGKLPKIVIPVHFAGQPCDMKAIYELGKRYGFHIIEDAAHAIGAKYMDEVVGNCKYSDITVFSFHPVKIITTGEGGVALTNSPKLVERMNLLRSHGITKKPHKMKKKLEGSWYYEQISLGFNYRMTDIQAALGISQISRIDQFVAKRHEIAARYNQEFRALGIITPKQKRDSYSSYHLYVIMLKKRASKNHRKIFTKLKEGGVGVNLHYISIYKHPYYQSMDFENSYYPNAEKYYQQSISLPIYPTLTEKEQTKVIRLLRGIIV